MPSSIGRRAGTRCGGHRRCHDRLRSGRPAHRRGQRARPARGRSAAAATFDARRAGRAQGRVRPPPGADPGGLDDVGVGRRAGRPARGVDAGRRAAGLAARRGRGRAAHPGGRGTAPVDRPARRAHPAARPRLRRHHPLRRRERPVHAYTYAAGAATGPRVVADGLPDAKCPDLRGASTRTRSRASPSARTDALYFSIGSSGNISADDRDADPAARLDHADPAGRRPARGLRPRCAQRHRARRRPRRLGLDGGEQPRQHRSTRSTRPTATRGRRRRAR